MDGCGDSDGGVVLEGEGGYESEGDRGGKGRKGGLWREEGEGRVVGLGIGEGGDMRGREGRIGVEERGRVGSRG